MLRSYSLFTVVGLLLLAQSSAVLAQPGRRGGRRRGGAPTIDRAAALGVDQVREELKIDEAQGATIQAALDAYREERSGTRPDRSQFQFLSDEERQELRDKQQKQREEASRNVDETLAVLLEPDQLKRLDEIIIQVQLKLTPAEVVRKKLKLTEDQLAKLKTVEADAAEKLSEMRLEIVKKINQGEGDVGFSEIRKMSEKFQKEVQTSAFAILTESQNTALTELQGKEFEIDLMSLMRGRGRGGPGAGRRGGGGGPREGRGQRQRPNRSEKSE
jgi:hypothetical protein